MSNPIDIKTDGINVYVTIQVKSKSVGKIILGVMIFFLFAAFSLFIFNLGNPEIRKAIFVVPLLFIVLIYFPVKYFLWNLSGKENLVLTTRSVSFNYDYGIILTPKKTVLYNRLGMEIQPVRYENETKLGKMIFYNYKTENNLPEVIHETTVLVDVDKLKEIETLTELIFKNEMNETMGFVPYSLN